MPTKAVQQFINWSYSRWSDWRQCPFLAKLKHIEKRKEPVDPNGPLERGNAIHKEGERYLLGEVSTVPSSYKLFKKEMVALRKAAAIPEGQWAHSRTWDRLTDYFDRGAWLRLKIDAHHLVRRGKAVVLRIIDFKTGKIRDGYGAQLELYATTGLISYPEADQVETELWYLDQGEIRGGTSEHSEGGAYTRDQLPELRKAWEDRVAPMLADRRFDPTPSWLCRYCHFRKSNNGPCKF